MVAAGDRIGGRYLLEERIAAGGMGTVFRAIDERLGRAVAVKLLKPELVHDPRFVERFRREARAVAALSHPNIANVYDYGNDEESHFIVMELAGGRDLSVTMTESGPLGPDRTVHIAAQIAAALGHAHAAGVIHRDVKPANVIVDDDDTVKVTDFGIARAVGDSTLTATGTLLGTATYLSPEQAQGLPLDARSDIYSLGIVMFEMLTGEVPFKGDSAVNVAMRHLTGDVPSVGQLGAQVPAWLDALVLKATRKEREERFTDGDDLATALSIGDAAGTTTVGAAGPRGTAVLETQTDRRPVLAVPPHWDAARVGRTVLWVGGGLLILAVILVLWRLGQGEPTAERIREEATTQPAEESPTEEDTEPEQLVLEIPEEMIGSDASTARAFLEDLGFEVEEESVEHEEPEGTVVGTDPEVGDTAEVGDTITLYVSDGSDSKGPPGGEPPGKDKKDKEDDDD